MIEELMTAYGSRLLIAVIGVGIALICLVGILRLLRGRNGPSPFVRGGKNRQPRLQVLDAAAVDARRRIVLLRRDDVEHLVMIGGPTDIVIESRIGRVDAPLPVERPEPPSPSPPPRSPRAEQPRIETRPDPRAEPARERAVEPVSRALARGEPAPRETPPADNARQVLAREPAPAPPRASLTPQTGTPPVARIPSVAAPVRPEPAHEAPAEVQRLAVAATETVSVTQAKTSAAAAPDLREASSILEAARSRVLNEHASAPARVVPLTPVAAAPAPLIDIPATPAQKALGSDFEKILEEEMAQNLSSRPTKSAPSLDIAADAERSSNQTAPLSGLQNEVARIFGEMSASRDK